MRNNNFVMQVVNPKTGELSVTNVFHYTFLIKDKIPPTIIPKTYHEVKEETKESVKLTCKISVDDVSDRPETFQVQHRAVTWRHQSTPSVTPISLLMFVVISLL